MSALSSNFRLNDNPFKVWRQLTPLARLPVNDSVPVQEHQSRRDLGGVKARPRLVELPRALNLKHQVASVDVLHHEEQAVLERERSTESTWLL